MRGASADCTPPDPNNAKPASNAIKAMLPVVFFEDAEAGAATAAEEDAEDVDWLLSGAGPGVTLMEAGAELAAAAAACSVSGPCSTVGVEAMSTSFADI